MMLVMDDDDENGDDDADILLYCKYEYLPVCNLVLH